LGFGDNKKRLFRKATLAWFRYSFPQSFLSCQERRATKQSRRSERIIFRNSLLMGCQYGGDLPEEYQPGDFRLRWLPLKVMHRLKQVEDDNTAGEVVTDLSLN
jgi:hypothetical protein